MYVESLRYVNTFKKKLPKANNDTDAGGCCGKVSAGTRSYEISRFESFVGLLLVSLSMVFLL